MFQLFLIFYFILICINCDKLFRYYPRDPPNCPAVPGRESEVEFPMLYDNSTGSCYIEHTVGSCGGNMILYRDFGYENAKKYGFCDCDDILLQLYPTSSVERISSVPPRAQIFIPSHNACYPAFSQGPCPTGKWLILNHRNVPACAKNSCLKEPGYVDEPSSNIFWFAKMGKCYKTFSQGYCMEGKRLQPSEYFWTPKCENYFTTINAQEDQIKCSSSSSPLEDLKETTGAGSYYFDYEIENLSKIEQIFCRIGRRSRHRLQLCQKKYEDRADLDD